MTNTGVNSSSNEEDNTSIKHKIRSTELDERLDEGPERKGTGKFASVGNRVKSAVTNTEEEGVLGKMFCSHGI